MWSPSINQLCRYVFVLSCVISIEAQDGALTSPAQDVDALDVNHNPPVQGPSFNGSIYRAIVRETYAPGYNVITVKAQADDQVIDSHLKYELTGDPSPFIVDDTSGTIIVHTPLDYESEQQYLLTLTVSDGSYNRSTTVQIDVIDENDNAPKFSQKVYTVEIEENKDPDDFGGSVYVTTVRAVDFDDPKTKNGQVEYQMLLNKQIDGHDLFSIDRYNGKINALMKFDRENPTQRQFEIEVRATDKGNPTLSGTAKVLVNVRDVNDNAPRFDKGMYFGSVFETAALDTPVLTVSAEDADDQDVLDYELKDSGKGYQFFYMTLETDTSGSNVGILRVKKLLDKEDSGQRSFTVHIEVFDGKHYTSTEAEIYVLDANDNPPAAVGPQRNDTKKDKEPGITITESSCGVGMIKQCLSLFLEMLIISNCLCFFI